MIVTKIDENVTKSVTMQSKRRDVSEMWFPKLQIGLSHDL